jgi:hypothetical protein
MYVYMYVPSVQKNQEAWNFLSPEQEVMRRTVAIKIRVDLFSPNLCIRGISLSSIHYNQSSTIYGNQYIRFIRS